MSAQMCNTEEPSLYGTALLGVKYNSEIGRCFLRRVIFGNNQLQYISSFVWVLIVPVCARCEACLVNIHCFPFKHLIICMGNTETHYDGGVEHQSRNGNSVEFLKQQSEDGAVCGLIHYPD